MTGQERPENRVSASIAVHSWAVLNGAKIVRVHNVRETADALKTINSVRRGIQWNW